MNQLSYREPIVFVQIDLDGLWAIRQCYGYPEGDSFEKDPVFTEALPQILALLEEYKIKATFFVCGRDLELPQKAAILQETMTRGHEIANHSYHHIVGLTLLPLEKIHQEIELTQNIIKEKLNFQAKGFRSPGYDVNLTLWQSLAELNFLYDASLFPTFWSGVLRTFVNLFLKKGPGKTKLFGFRAFRSLPLIPFRLAETPPLANSSAGKLWEIPISVSPTLRLPIQISYCQILGARHFIKAAEHYRRRNFPLTCLLHGIDLVDTTKIELLPHSNPLTRALFRISWQRKIATVKTILKYLNDNFATTTITHWLNNKKF